MPDAAIEDLAVTGQMVTDLLASEPDPDLPATPAWTVRQVAVHLIAGGGMYAGCLRGARSPLGDMRTNTLSAFNEGAFVALTERNVAALAQLHSAAIADVRAAAEEADPDRLVPFHAGTERSVHFMVTAMASEQLLHGWDVARAIGHPWHPDQALTARLSRFFLATAPFLYRGKRAAVRRGQFWVSPTGDDGWGFDIFDDRISANGARDTATCHVTGDGFDVMLWLSGRTAWAESSLIASGPQSTLAEELPASFYSA